jgi:hypothetical protein
VIKAWPKSLALILATQKKISLKNHPQDNRAIRILGELYLLLAKQPDYRNNQSKFSYCNKTITLLKPLIKLSSHLAYLKPYARAHACTNQLNLIPNERDLLSNMGITNIIFLPNPKRRNTSE